jgi:uncharacterized membrane protein
METLTAVFDFLCGQERCFVVDGAALPVCQRCTGLYVGALLAGFWLFASRTRQRGVPPARLAWAYAAVLIAALLGGVHVLDFGPRWRFLCGLWTGQVVLVWLFTGTTQLSTWACGSSGESLFWTRRDKLGACAMLALAPILALASPMPHGTWSVWTAAIVGGALLLGITGLRTAWAAIRAVTASTCSTQPEKCE